MVPDPSPDGDGLASLVVPITGATMTAAASVSPSRRHDLDWLRAGAILLLLFFHSAMPYVAEWSWHVRNPETSELLLEFNFFVSRFRMALLFVIAGVASQFVLQRRTVAGFLRDRVARLIVPLVFGAFVIVPPQIYFERLAQGAFDGSYLAFWPRTLAMEPYPSGDFSYHHLWFIFYLFLYSVLLVPIMAAARRPRGETVLRRTRQWLAKHGVHVLAVPIVTVYTLLVQSFSGAQDVVHDLAMFLVYFFYFATGWVIGVDHGIWQRIMERRRYALTAAFLMLLVINGLRWNDADPARGYAPARLAYLALLGAHAWCWVMAILGYGRRWLDRDHPILAWTRDASYPFYIIHQTVIVAVAYYVIPTQEPVLAKFLFTSVVSLLVTVGLYETLVRPFNGVRWLFGMNPVRSVRTSQT
jgi:glucans biosynthesis protein C